MFWVSMATLGVRGTLGACNTETNKILLTFVLANSLMLALDVFNALFLGFFDALQVGRFVSSTNDIFL